MSGKKAKEKARTSSLENDITALSRLIDTLATAHNASFSDVLNTVRETKDRQQSVVRSSIFLEKKLGIMESLVKYLREEKQLSYHAIALSLKRDDRVIWATYNNARRKVPKKIIYTHQGPLEAIVRYLRDTATLSFNDIAKMLNRSNKTVWAVYHRRRS